MSTATKFPGDVDMAEICLRLELFPEFLEALFLSIPKGIDPANPALPDSKVVPINFTMAEVRKIHALIDRAYPETEPSAPPPIADQPSQVTQRLIDQLTTRDQHGKAKYGTSLDRKDLSIEEWLQHGIEEALDLAGYLEAAKREIAELRAQKAATRTAVVCAWRYVRADGEAHAWANPPIPQQLTDYAKQEGASIELAYSPVPNEIAAATVVATSA